MATALMSLPFKSSSSTFLSFFSLSTWSSCFWTYPAWRTVNYSAGNGFASWHLLYADNLSGNSRMPKKTIPKILKDLTWQKWVGDHIAKAKCLCCGINDIKMNSFHCGHVISEADGGPTTVENLRPICATCNLSMRTQNMVKFKENHGLGTIGAGQQTALHAQAAQVSINEHRIQASTMIGSTSVSLSVPIKTVFQGIKSLF